MAMTLSLTIQDSQALRAVALAAKCTADDFKYALGRCPGAPEWDQIVPNQYTMETLADTIMDRVSTDWAYLRSSFLLRVIEQAWMSDAIRRGVTNKLPSLLRPPRGVATHVETLTAALDTMSARLPAAVAAGMQVDDLFRRLCEGRSDIVRMVASLRLLAALKSIHDALHTLQVLGADWLDAPIKPGGPPPPEAPLLALLARVTASTAAPAPELPEEIVASCLRCHKTCTEATDRIRGGNRDEIDFAYAALRGMLMREPPLIDSTMFAVSRDFPLVLFCNFFDTPAARDAAIDLGDTLRRRLMEHALWQATDLNLYQIEQILAHPPENLKGELANRMPWGSYYLRALLDAPTQQRVLPPMNDVLLRFVDPGGTAATFDDICAAFRNLRNAARSAFLDVDQALKEDFLRLLKLQQPLETILKRVPEYCTIVL